MFNNQRGANNIDMPKKLREQALIEEFMAICPYFNGFALSAYSENPDLVYRKGNINLGFDSVIIAQDQNTVDCHFDSEECRLTIRDLVSSEVLLKQASELLIRNLFKHIRAYQIPTVLVFSVLDDKIDLNLLAQHFKLPEFKSRNIRDYYLSNKHQFVKVSEADK